MTELSNRYDFVMLFDVVDGNPNGDPDAGNLPRIDPETSHGLVSDVCLKRKVRNYVLLSKKSEAGYELFVKEKGILNNEIDKVFKELQIDLTIPPSGKEKRQKAKTAQDEEVDKGRVRMCSKFYDVRTFGAVMSTGANAGQVRGPVQLTFSRSVDPIVPLEHSITRMAVTKPEDAEEQGGDNRTMGRKNTVPYGLYRASGFISPQFAKQTKFSADDLALLWQSLGGMFEMDRSAARGLMSLRKLIVFKHESPLGNAPAFQLFDSVKVIRQNPDAPPRSFQDYKVEVGTPPSGVTIESPVAYAK
jgi:CRISPR-associated protein Csd2